MEFHRAGRAVPLVETQYTVMRTPLLIGVRRRSRPRSSLQSTRLRVRPVLLLSTMMAAPGRASRLKTAGVTVSGSPVRNQRKPETCSRRGVPSGMRKASEPVWGPSRPSQLPFSQPSQSSQGSEESSSTPFSAQLQPVSGLCHSSSLQTEVSPRVTVASTWSDSW